MDGNSPGQLTVTERRVAELAVAGHSNPEIAQALFVTRKTVETTSATSIASSRSPAGTRSRQRYRGTHKGPPRRE
jgi:FixJ family two-component response regulator